MCGMRAVTVWLGASLLAATKKDLCCPFLSLELDRSKLGTFMAAVTEWLQDQERNTQHVQIKDLGLIHTSTGRDSIRSHCVMSFLPLL